MDYDDIDARVNKWLGAIAGLPINATSATFLRCELGVLPSQLVGERNALYYLWHLRNRTWFKRHLPHLQHLPPLARLTELLLDYDVTLEEFHRVRDVDKWHDLVKDAVLNRAESWYSASSHSQRLPNFRFVYRGQQYLRLANICQLSEVAIQARADRLTGVPNEWLHQECPYCHTDGGLHGAHLLQCDSLPDQLAQQRNQLRQDQSIRAYTSRVLVCDPSFSELKQGLCFAQRVLKTTRRACQAPPPSSQTSDGDREEFAVSQ